MNLFDPSMLATGGIIAAVIAGWNQVKTAFRYVSSFVVATATYPHSLTLPVLRYVRDNYTMLPSGQFLYGIKVRDVQGASAFVPYRTLPITSVFFRKFRFIIVKYTTNGVSITTLRGLVDLDAIAGNAALQDFNQFFVERTNRFYVSVYRGQEKFQGQLSVSGSRPNQSVKDAAGYSQPDVMSDYDKMLGFSPQDIESKTNVTSHLFFDQEIESHIKDAELWLKSKTWYQSRGIPWRRGWCLYGPAGSGKSSLAREVAFRLKIPVHSFVLNTMSDKEFDEYWYSVERPAVILFEDFDNVFEGREALSIHKSLSFDFLLNTISGVSSKDGTFLIVTTNHPEKLDPALGVALDNTSLSTRPGRIDRAIYVGPMTREGRSKLIQSILRDWPEDWESTIDQTEGMVVAQVQEVCVQHAFNKLSR